MPGKVIDLLGQIFPPMIGALGTIGGSLLGTSMQSRYNEAAWRMQNEYNSPKNQMALYKAGGFNPASVFSANGKLDSSADAIQAPDLSGAMNAASGAVSNALNMAMLRQQMKNLKLEGESLKEDVRGKDIANDVAAARAKEEIANAESIYDYGEEYVNLPRPESDHPWTINDEGYWVYTDDFGRVHRSNYSDWSDFEVRFKDNKRRKQLAKFDYNTKQWTLNATMAKAKLDAIEYAIKDVYGPDIAQKTIDELQSRIELAQEQKRSFKLDNDSFEAIGIGNKAADGIIRLIIGILSNRF